MFVVEFTILSPFLFVKTRAWGLSSLHMELPHVSIIGLKILISFSWETCEVLNIPVLVKNLLKLISSKLCCWYSFKIIESTYCLNLIHCPFVSYIPFSSSIILRNSDEFLDWGNKLTSSIQTCTPFEMSIGLRHDYYAPSSLQKRVSISEQRKYWLCFFILMIKLSSLSWQFFMCRSMIDLFPEPAGPVISICVWEYYPSIDK